MSSKSTSIDLGNNNKELSQEKIDRFSLKDSLIDLLWTEPFYSSILRNLTKKETSEIPTAGVTTTGDDFILYYNKAFMASLTRKQVIGILKHECLHLVYRHTTERIKEPFLIWNYGTDLAINSIIGKGWLPEGCLMPGENLEDIPDDVLGKMDQSKINAYYKLSNQIKNFPPNKTSEYYFEKLLEEGHAEEVAEGEKEFNLNFDDHESWKDSSGGDDQKDGSSKDFVEKKIDELIKQAVIEADTKGWGSISSEARIQINKMISRDIRWESILKRFCGFSRKSERSSSIRRLNKKYPGIHPGDKKDYKPLIAVYVDESGSMSNNIIEKIYSELQTLSSRTDFYLYKFDTIVDEESSFLWKKGKRLDLRRTLNGGTTFDVAVAHALKNKSKFDGYIILTDGGSLKPRKSTGLRRCYILTPGCSLSFKPDRSDIVINMD